jgi:hypothetical protein
MNQLFLKSRHFDRSAQRGVEKSASPPTSPPSPDRFRSAKGAFYTSMGRSPMNTRPGTIRAESPAYLSFAHHIDPSENAIQLPIHNRTLDTHDKIKRDTNSPAQAGLHHLTHH